MSNFGAALLAMSAVQSISQIGQGYAQKSEANYNATIKENQASMIGLQSDIEQGQYQRMKGQYLSKSTAQIGAAGIAPEGSAAAVMLDTQAQIGIDQAIAKFNKTQEQNYALSEASAYKRAGKQAVYSGYSNAFSTMLQGVSNYAMYNGLGNKTSVGTRKDTTFDTNVSPGQLKTAYNRKY